MTDQMMNEQLNQNVPADDIIVYNESISIEPSLRLSQRVKSGKKNPMKINNNISGIKIV